MLLFIDILFMILYWLQSVFRSSFECIAPTPTPTQNIIVHKSEPIIVFNQNCCPNSRIPVHPSSPYASARRLQPAHKIVGGFLLCCRRGHARERLACRAISPGAVAQWRRPSAPSARTPHRMRACASAAAAAADVTERIDQRRISVKCCTGAISVRRWYLLCVGGQLNGL